MFKIPIDEKGYIDNPCLIDKPKVVFQKAWCALVFRSGRKIKIASFLPRERHGAKINVSGIPRGVYFKFFLATGKEETYSLYMVDQVTEIEISLLPVADTAIPSFYEIDSIAPTKAHLLEAKLAILEDQMDDLRRSIADLKKAAA